MLQSQTSKPKETITLTPSDVIYYTNSFSQYFFLNSPENVYRGWDCSKRTIENKSVNSSQWKSLNLRSTNIDDASLVDIEHLLLVSRANQKQVQCIISFVSQEKEKDYELKKQKFMRNILQKPAVNSALIIPQSCHGFTLSWCNHTWFDKYKKCLISFRWMQQWTIRLNHIFSTF